MYVATKFSGPSCDDMKPPNEFSAYILNAKCINVECEKHERTMGDSRGANAW